MYIIYDDEQSGFVCFRPATGVQLRYQGLSQFRYMSVPDSEILSPAVTKMSRLIIPTYIWNLNGPLQPFTSEMTYTKHENHFGNNEGSPKGSPQIQLCVLYQSFRWRILIASSLENDANPSFCKSSGSVLTHTVPSGIFCCAQM
jgi:hypothetical protein